MGSVSLNLQAALESGLPAPCLWEAALSSSRFPSARPTRREADVGIQAQFLFKIAGLKLQANRTQVPRRS
jgi:hypothetical protein